MADAVVSLLVQKLANLTLQEANYLLGVQGQIKRLEEEARWMQCFLKDADARRGTEEEAHEILGKWVAEIRETAYEAEDLVDTFALKIASRRRAGIWNLLKRRACILQEARTLHKIGSEVDQIAVKLSDLTRRLQTYGVRQRLDNGEGASTQEKERRRSFPHVIEDNVVGFESNVEELVSVLLDESKNFRIVSVCGMGGLGKTTLAKRVFHHGRVRRGFDHFAWAYVSKQCQRRDLWEGIILSLGVHERDKIVKLRDEELAENLHKFMKESRCLVVLDDIWSVQSWDSLKVAFPIEGTRSMIVLTSRNKEVALHADPRGFLHEPDCLNDEQSWELFQNVVSLASNDSEFAMERWMKELGKQMVKHCSGLPLVINSLAGLLVTKNRLHDWQVVHEYITSYIKKGNSHVQENGVWDVLAISYDDLKPHLKHCFLYLAHFPEGCDIPVSKLIQMWVAEGLVEWVNAHGEDEEPEDVAERYLNELIERCMVLVGERDANLKVKTCHLHDLMRDLCLVKAQEENFFCTVNGRSQQGIGINGNPLSKFGGPIRRIAVRELPGSVAWTKSPHVRSVWLLDKISSAEEQEAGIDLNLFSSLQRVLITNSRQRGLLSAFFSNFKSLRVLDLELFDAFILKFPNSVGHLIHLRFFSLGEVVVPALPSSLGNLSCLETLHLMHVLTYWPIPNVIRNMKKLRHLYLPRDYKGKLVFGNLKHLRTLVNFSAKRSNLKDLLCMENLRELVICDLLNSQDLTETLKLVILKLKRLKSLSIHGDSVSKMEVRPIFAGIRCCVDLYKLELRLAMEKLPDFRMFPANISHIELKWCRLEDDPMPVLEKLHNLRILHFLGKAVTGKKMICSTQGFPQLQSLVLSGQNNLEEWRLDEGAMPKLSHLRILWCDKLKMLPNGLSSTENLQQLEVKWMPKAFREKLVPGGEDFFKVKHVPCVMFVRCDKE